MLIVPWGVPPPVSFVIEIRGVLSHFVSGIWVNVLEGAAVSGGPEPRQTRPPTAAAAAQRNKLVPACWGFQAMHPLARTPTVLPITSSLIDFVSLVAILRTIGRIAAAPIAWTAAFIHFIDLVDLIDFIHFINLIDLIDFIHLVDLIDFIHFINLIDLVDFIHLVDLIDATALVDFIHFVHAAAIANPWRS